MPLVDLQSTHFLVRHFVVICTYYFFLYSIHILLFLTGLVCLLVWYYYILFLCCLGLPGLTQWPSSEAYFL
ncbi:hypothetical protein EDC96DRAFT_534154 [Choanephora cucurbitarum]|nr:hypothetical protein EDC96DRAFT_534154 [Choanephora cucurbitarum]